MKRTPKLVIDISQLKESSLLDLINALPKITAEAVKAEAKRQGLPSYPNAVRDASRILAERRKSAKRCPNCGGPLDMNGCCKVCNICVRR